MRHLTLRSKQEINYIITDYGDYLSVECLFTDVFPRCSHLWDEDLAKWRVVEKLDAQTDVFQYVINSMVPHPSRDFCELR